MRRKGDRIVYRVRTPSRDVSRRSVSMSRAVSDKVYSASDRWGLPKSRILDILINLALDKEGAK